ERRTAHQPAPAAARHERDARVCRPADDRGDLVHVARLEHGEREDAPARELGAAPRGAHRVDARGREARRVRVDDDLRYDAAERVERVHAWTLAPRVASRDAPYRARRPGAMTGSRA